MKNKVVYVQDGILYFFLMFILSQCVPLILGIVIFDTFSINENASVVIGNTIFMFSLIVIYRRMFKENLKDFKNNFKVYFKKVLKYWGIGLLLMYVFNLILNTFVFNEIAANEAANRENIKNSLIVSSISISLLGPFIEEMVFRFGIRRITKNKYVFPIISALIFGFMHCIVGINEAHTISDKLLELFYILPYGSLGFAFAYLYNETDNILTSILAHVIHNSVTLLLLMLVI